MTEQTDIVSKVIVFQLKGEEYAIPVEYVGSIERMQQITRVPQTAEFVQGVINLRGVVTPVINLRKRFAMDNSEYTDRTRIIITHVNDMEVGLIVDAAYDVIDIPNDAIEPPLEVVGAVDVDYISGVVHINARLLILLNVEKVLNKQALQELNV